MKNIYEEIDKLAELLNNREEVKKIKEIEEKMMNDEEVLKLSNDLAIKENEFNSCLNHYQETSEEVNKAKHELYIAKLMLDEHPLVKEYYHYLSLVNEPLRYIEFNLLNKFSNKNHNCGKK